MAVSATQKKRTTQRKRNAKKKRDATKALADWAYAAAKKRGDVQTMQALRAGTVQHQAKLIAASKTFENVDAARHFLRYHSVRESTAASYIACAQRLDEWAKEAGFEAGMRTKDAFIMYAASRAKSGLAGGVSTLTYQRSALEFRERCETNEPWPDDDEIRDLIRCHNYIGKVVRSISGKKLRGALTRRILADVSTHMDFQLFAVVWVQYWACLRPHEVLGLTFNCLIENGTVIVIDTNKKFRKSNAAKTSTSQRKPLCDEAQQVIGPLVERERQGRNGGDRLFSLSAPQYRQKLAAAIKKAKLDLPAQLVFVPHSIRHGRATDMRMENQENMCVSVLTPDQLAQAGMSREVSTRYCRTNDERVLMAMPGETIDDSSSSDEEPDEETPAAREARKRRKAMTRRPEEEPTVDAADETAAEETAAAETAAEEAAAVQTAADEAAPAPAAESAAKKNKRNGKSKKARAEDPPLQPNAVRT